MASVASAVQSAKYDATSYMAMGASLLSQQPPTAPAKNPQKEQADWNQIFQHGEQSINSMRMWRWSWWAYWCKLAEFFCPRRFHWTITANVQNKGNPINDAIIDGTGSLAVNTCASGMWAGLTNPARPWIKLGISSPGIDEDADAKTWLEDTQERLYTVLDQSNFYTEMAQAFEDLTVFGTAPPIIYEDYEDVIRVYLPCAGEYFLRAGARMSIDTIAREFNLTVSQIVEQFTLDNCPLEVQKRWAEGGTSLDIEYTVYHLIEPNFDLAKRGKQNGKIQIVPSHFTYRELYWLKGIKGTAPLSKRGFRIKPFFPMRWKKTSNDPYGRSPCMDAFGDNKQVQMETREKAEFIKKLTKPPMGAAPELKNEPASIWPGHITYTTTKEGFWPLFQVAPAALAPMVDDIHQISARIDKALFVNVFMAITQMAGVQPRNELELTKRDLERLQALGPVINLVEGELKNMIERVLEIMGKRTVQGKDGKLEPMLKPLPKSLQGVALKIEFVSIMRMAQRSAQAVGAKDFLQTMGGLSSAAKAAGVPDPLRTVNLDKTASKLADITDFWSDCMFTPSEVAQHDQIRQHAMQAAQAAQQIPQAGMAAVNAAKTLAQTPTGPGTALSALMNPSGGAPGA